MKYITTYMKEIRMAHEALDLVKADMLEVFNKSRRHDITKCVMHRPATVLYFADGSKAVTRCRNEDFDGEKAIAIAVMKHLYGRDWYKIMHKCLRMAGEETCENS